ncbi:MAG: hypothetical protein ACM31C_14560 [Acidobacteriota bacterium]
MRALALIVLLGCHHGFHPAVIPNLSQAPEDKRDDLIQTPLVRPTPEQRPKTRHGLEQETFAATAAAILGQAFSKTENTTLGWEWIDVEPAQRPRATGGDGTPAPAPAPPVDPDGLVPWIKLDPAR